MDWLYFHADFYLIFVLNAVIANQLHTITNFVIFLSNTLRLLIVIQK